MSAKSFAAALAHGAVGFVARLVREGVHPFQIIQQIRGAYRGMNMGEVSQTYWLGVGAHSAAVEQGRQDASTEIPLGEIPVNPGSIPQEQAGNRFRYQTIGTYQIPGEATPRYATINLYSPTQISNAELMAYYQQQFDQLAGGSPRIRAKLQGSVPTILSVDILDIQRGF